MASNTFEVGEYRDEVHAESLDDLQTAEYGYKYRMIDGRMMPPYITPERYALSRRIKTRPSDICYSSFPKSGSTWLAYILVLIVNNGRPPEDQTLRGCLHWVASSWTYPRTEKELEDWPEPRIFKSHMPYSMALGGTPAENPCKYVYIARNPKDVAVSYYHFERDKSWSGGYSGPWEHWLELFRNGRVQRGDWFDHVLGWWRASRQESNIYFLTYERLLQDFCAEVGKLSRFLGRPLNEEALERIRQASAFAAMSTAEFSRMGEIKEFSGFFRKGRVGSWREQFTSQESAAFDELCRARLQDSGLEFEYEVDSIG